MIGQNPHTSTLFDIVSIAPGNPAAGANFTFGVPANSRIRPVSIQFVLTTDANVANRLVQVGFNDGALTFNTGLSPILQTASSVRNYFFNVGIGADRELLGGAGFNQEFCSLNNAQWLRVGDSIVSIIGNIQVGDQISGLQIRYEQQITPL